MPVPANINMLLEALKQFDTQEYDVPSSRDTLVLEQLRRMDENWNLGNLERPANAITRHAGRDFIPWEMDEMEQGMEWKEDPLKDRLPRVVPSEFWEEET